MHAGDTTAVILKTPDFSPLLEFLVGTLHNHMHLESWRGTGCNYDLSDEPTIYRRATFICKMHKARVRANDYYWTKLKKRGTVQPALRSR